MLNWIDVVDTATKIGLGALIAGFFALMSSIISHRNQLSKDKVKRLSKALEEISQVFESTLSQIYLAGIRCAKYIDDESVQYEAIHNYEIERDKKIDEFQALIDSATSELFKLDGRLRLYGCGKTADIIQEIIDRLLKTPSSINPEAPWDHVENFRSAFQEISLLKNKLYLELSMKTNSR